MRHILINNFLHSARILGDACEKLRPYRIGGVETDRAPIDVCVSLGWTSALSAPRTSIASSIRSAW